MKVLKYVTCLLAMALITVSSSAFSGTTPIPKPGQGEQNCNHTGDGGPGPGPDSLACLSALTTGNPVLILDACVFLDAEGDNSYQFKYQLQHPKKG